jgi:hypothetical protein
MRRLCQKRWSILAVKSTATKLDWSLEFGEVDSRFVKFASLLYLRFTVYSPDILVFPWFFPIFLTHDLSWIFQLPQ